MRFYQLIPYGSLALLAALLPTLPAAAVLLWSGARRAPWVVAAVLLPTLVGAGTGAWWLRFHADGWFHEHWAEIPALWWLLVGTAFSSACAAFLACVAGVRTLAEGREASTPTPHAAARSSIVLVSALGVAALVSPAVAVGVALAGIGSVLANLRRPSNAATQSLSSFLTTLSLTAATIWVTGIAAMWTWSRTLCDLTHPIPLAGTVLLLALVVLSGWSATLHWRQWLVQPLLVGVGIVAFGAALGLSSGASLERAIERQRLDLPVFTCARRDLYYPVLTTQGPSPTLRRCKVGNDELRLVGRDEPLRDLARNHAFVVRRPDGSLGTLPVGGALRLRRDATGTSFRFEDRQIAHAARGDFVVTLARVQRVVGNRFVAVELEPGQTLADATPMLEPLESGCGLVLATPLTQPPVDLLAQLQPEDASADLLDALSYVHDYYDADDQCSQGWHTIDVEITDAGPQIRGGDPCLHPVLLAAPWGSVRGPVVQPIFTWY